MTRKKILLVCVMLVLSSVLLFFVIGHYRKPPQYTYMSVLPEPQHDIYGFKALKVAHAGGGIHGATYTNSYDALDVNVAKGFQYFEIDFSFTSDDELVCLHNWKKTFKRTFGFQIESSLSIEEFKQLVDTEAKYKNCTLDGLAAWMKNNPTAYLVTDVKEKKRNIEALTMMLASIPSAKTRVIPQIYSPEHFDAVKNMGFEQIIWTLYRSGGATIDEIIDWVLKFRGPIAITMSKSRAKTVLPVLLKRMNIPTYVHTINSREQEAKYLTIYDISEVYTDFLQP